MSNFKNMMCDKDELDIHNGVTRDVWLRSNTIADLCSKCDNIKEENRDFTKPPCYGCDKVSQAAWTEKRNIIEKCFPDQPPKTPNTPKTPKTPNTPTKTQTKTQIKTPMTPKIPNTKDFNSLGVLL